MAKNKWPQIQSRLLLVEKWARDGLTEEQICKNLGISRTTFYEYKNKYPDILNALKKGKEVHITEVENALIKRALGFTYEETETYIKDIAGSKTQMIKKVTKYCPPDVGACAIILKNKDKDHYSDNPGMLELKRKMLELQKKAQEKEEW